MPRACYVPVSTPYLPPSVGGDARLVVRSRARTQAWMPHSGLALLVLFVGVSGIAAAATRQPEPISDDISRLINARPLGSATDRVSRAYLSQIDAALRQIDAYDGSWRPDVAGRVGTGPMQAPILLVIYGDMATTASHFLVGSARRAREDHVDTLRVVHKHFPQQQATVELARYVEAAAALDARKAFYLLLRVYAEGAEDAPTGNLDALAQELGMVPVASGTDAWKKATRLVEADVQEGRRLGLETAPGVWIHGAAIKGAVTYRMIEFVADYAERRRHARAPLPEKLRNATAFGSLAAQMHADRRPAEEVDGLYRRALSFDPRHAGNLSGYGAFLAERGDLDGAELLLRRATAVAPGNAKAMDDYAVFLLESRRDPSGAGHWRRAAVEAAPQHPRILRRYAEWLERHTPDRQRADGYYRRALQADPDHPRSLSQYAKSLDRLGDPGGRAEALFRRAAITGPASAEYIGDVAKFLEARGRLDEAEAFYRRAVRHPSWTTYVRAYATFLDERRHAPQLADALFVDIMTDHPGDALYPLTYARFLEEHRRDYARAEQYYRAGIATDPGSAWGLGRLAVLLALRRHDLPQAEIYFRRATHLSPDSPSVLANHAQALFIWGRNEEAMQIAARATALASMPEEGHLELLFYRAAHEPAAWPKMLESIASYLERGVRSAGWPLQANVDRAERDGHPNPQLLRQLARVISAEATIDTLRGLPEWPSATR